MATALTPSIIRDQVLAAVIGLAEDPIPNVRFNVAKTLKVIAPMLKKEPAPSDEQVAQTLVKLSGDSDVDVRYFAEKALVLGKH